MVEIVELSSSEERSDITVPANNSNPDGSRSAQTHSDKSPSSDSPKNTKDTSNLNNNSATKVDDSQANNASEPKVESSKGDASEVSNKDSSKGSGGSGKEASPNKKPDEPVVDNSPVSSDDESSPGSFTVTSNALYHENDQGKELFVKGDYDAAIQRWSKSIENLTTVLDKSRKNPDHGITEDALHEFTKMYVILCSNLALAHIKKENYDKCKEYCQYVLMYDDKSLKAHLRIVQADVKLRNFEQALKNCNKGLEFHPDNQELIALKSQINAALKRYENVEKLFCQNAFKKIEVDPRSEQVHPPPPGPGAPPLSLRLLMLYHRVHFYFKQVLLSIVRFYTSTRSTIHNKIHHTYTLVTRPLHGLLKKLKLS